MDVGNMAWKAWSRSRDIWSLGFKLRTMQSQMDQMDNGMDSANVGVYDPPSPVFLCAACHRSTFLQPMIILHILVRRVQPT